MSCPSISLRLHLIPLALAISASTVPAQPSGICLQGTYEYSLKVGGPKASFAALYSFDVSTWGCKWVIAYEDLTAATNADLVNVRSVASCDGTNIYLIQFQNESGARKLWGERYDLERQNFPVAQATIYPGTYPPPQEFVLQHIWFALASGCVLGEPKGRTKSPFVTDLEVFYSPGFGLDYVWGTNRDTGGYRYIALRSDGTLLTRHPTSGKMIRAKLAPPYDEGYTNGIGIWKNVTNFAGTTAPLDYEFTAFAPTLNARKPTDLAAAHSYRCAVTNVGRAQLIEVPTRLPEGKIIVADRRFIEQGYAEVTYVATNWLSLDDPRLIDRIANSRKSSLEDEAFAGLGRPPPRSESTRYLVWLLIGLPLALWAIRVGVVRRRRKTPGEG